MKHNNPFERPWYDQRSIDNNPLRKYNVTNPLESIVEGYSTDNNSTNQSYAGRIASKILSAMPGPAKRIAAVGLTAAILGMSVSAGSGCGNCNEPTPPHTPTPVVTPTPTVDSLCDYECQQKTPGGYVGYQFGYGSFSKYEIIFNWSDTPKENDVGIYPALLHFWFADGGGYTGPQIEVHNSGTKIVKKVIFSIWSNSPVGFTAHPYCPHCVYGDTEGNFAQCVIHNDPSATRGQYYEQIWVEGKDYKITVQKDEELADGVVWEALIEDLESGEERLVGKIKLDDQEPYKGYGLLNGSTGGFFEYYFGSHNNCLEAEYGRIIRIGPIANGNWLPRYATYQHSECIRAETYSPEVGVIIEEVGEGVERSPEESLEGILWEFRRDIHISELPQLQNLFQNQ